MAAAHSRPDVLGAPYRCEDIDLGTDDEGAVVATLVHRRPLARSRPAVLHVHGFADYFFQVDWADYWVEQGYDFYALDLRKYGRSIRPHQTPNYTDDLTVYFDELDEAYRLITERDGHRQVVVSAHSTGGLIVALWAAASRPQLAGLVLNAPFLELAGSFLVRTGIGVAADRLGGWFPKREIPRSVTGLYAKSLHRDHAGEWDFDLEWKPLASWPVYAGWLRAVYQGQQQAHGGLDLEAPILVLTSERSCHPREWIPDVDRTDIVLDVAELRRRAPALGSRVTSIAVRDALHDVSLSRPDVRAVVKDEVTRWLGAYVPISPTPAPRRRSSRS